jgi:hypothetical protein
MKQKKITLSRRQFIGTAATAAAGFTILPSYVISGLGHRVPSDKLNIAGVGVGGVGGTNVHNCLSENIVALCDVDWKYASKTFEKHPDAKNTRITGRCSTRWAIRSMR